MVAAWRASGLPAEQWCQAQGVSASSLYRWLAAAQPPRCVPRAIATNPRPREVTFERLLPAPGFCEATNVARRSIVLELMVATGPARIRIDAGADLATVSAILNALATVTTEAA